MAKVPDLKKPADMPATLESKPIAVPGVGAKIKARDRVWTVLSSHEGRGMVVAQTCDDHPQLAKQVKKFPASEIVEIVEG